MGTKPTMSDASSLEQRVLIEKLSHRPHYLLNAMIAINIPQSTSAPAASSRPLPGRISSLGALDRLSPEILSMLLDALDFLSLADFARVSYRANDLIHSQRSYQDLVNFAPQALSALRRAGLIRLHSAAHLHDALRSRQCATCIEHGAFLFLPTGERCCWQCLRDHPSLRMILPQEAKRYFCLSERDVKRLTTLDVIPGVYGISANPMPEHLRLVSAQAAAELGLEIHGSTENLARALTRRFKSNKYLVTGRFLQSGITMPRHQDLLFMPSQGNIPNDNYFGTASVPFPSLSRYREIDHGLWCRGCELTVRHYDHARLPQDVLAGIVPLNRQPQRILVGLERRSRSRESFSDHMKNCYGALRLVSELAKTVA
ncbi:hypothetical protein CTA2_11296 [Colletotrichum tanaceti]|uniref:F-box domain-containing protein n=1 Tax=Colletotrichum tanaceti TaxID=1306861 RepID=A0A4V6DIB6_9PEZI|nr:hypothetical protein CTA2_11296 [Colletotrichum tanaceti]TKW59796.1 hypothetical protein CTA1_10403 [Colletotrichum tanaceti]